MRTSRLQTSTPELDAAEAEWWDRFSPVSERVWVLEPQLASALRSAYLRRAVEHLRPALGAGERILDLGCGSGFVCRELAAAGLPVLGVDVSGEQVELAESLARGAAGEALMEFRQSDAGGAWSQGEQFGGVITHAFLHHLAEDELESVLAEARALLKHGGRAWFYEPVFFRGGRKGPSAVIRAVQGRALGALGRWLRSRGLSDEQSMVQLQEFELEAEQSGYFLSPKEIPFQSDELISLLERHFEVGAMRWENTTSYQLATEINLLSSPRAREAGRRLVSTAARLDGLTGSKGMLDRYRGLSGYGFASGFCVARER